VLVREKYRLRDAVVAKIDGYRKSAHEQAFKSFFDARSKVEVTPELVFSFDPQEYPCPVNSLYRGQHSFKKHYYPDVDGLTAAKKNNVQNSLTRWTKLSSG